MRTVDAVFAAFTVLFGSWISYMAIGYGYSTEGNPGPGFFPFWVGSAIAALGIVNVLRALSGLEILSDAFDKRTVLKTAGITVAVAAFIAIAPWMGMLVGSALMVLAIGFVIRPSLSPSFSLRLLAVAIVFPAASWLIFVVYLNVRLVDGVLGF